MTALAALGLVVSDPVIRLLGLNAARWRAKAVTRWARRSARILGITLHVEGPVPQTPFVLVTNHLSYVDIVVLAAQVPLAFVAKSEVADWPIFGLLARATGTIFIDRERARDLPRAVGEIEKAFAGGIGVVLFPEATSSRGAEVLRFRPSLLEAAARGRLPVVYGALTYRTPPDEPPAHVVVAWWDDTSFPTHVLRLLGVRAIEARVRFAPERVFEDDRKLLAERLHSGVSSLFEPTAPPEPSTSPAPIS
jgi:1-acyl-sn-glycerol-3-phosphate acyltransferase